MIVRRLVLLVVAALLAAGCGGRASSGLSRGVAGAQTPVSRGCSAGEQRRLGSALSAVAAVVARSTPARRTPGGAVIERLAPTNANGVATVLGVLGERLDGRCRPAWLHVQLPIRPNGATGWVRAADVRTARVRTRILVDLSLRRVSLYRSGRLVLRATAAVGSPATPTPVGRYYVNQRLVPSDPDGPFGPGAVGISAFSPVLTGWAQGGPIAIHGTNQPWSIGRDVSNGCIRLPNAVLRRLFAATRAGTPVIIRP